MITPWRILQLNRQAQKLFNARTFLARTLGSWHTYQDQPGSKTCQIVYEEMARGHYDLQGTLEPGDTVVDVGAHVGMFTIPLAYRNPGVTFVAVEPDPDNFRNLMHNVKISGVKNVLMLHMGLWSSECEMAPVKHDPNNSGGSASQPVIDGYGECPGMTWTTFRELFGFMNIKVLKMDCEGAEYHIIQRPSDLKGVEEIIAEIHPNGPFHEMTWMLEQAPLSRLQVIPKHGQPYARHNGKEFVPGDMSNRCTVCGNRWGLGLPPVCAVGITCEPY